MKDREKGSEIIERIAGSDASALRATYSALGTPMTVAIQEALQYGQHINQRLVGYTSGDPRVERLQSIVEGFITKHQDPNKLFATLAGPMLAVSGIRDLWNLSELSTSQAQLYLNPTSRRATEYVEAWLSYLVGEDFRKRESRNNLEVITTKFLDGIWRPIDLIPIENIGQLETHNGQINVWATMVAQRAITALAYVRVSDDEKKVANKINVQTKKSVKAADRATQNASLRLEAIQARMARRTGKKGQERTVYERKQDIRDAFSSQNIREIPLRARRLLTSQFGQSVIESSQLRRDELRATSALTRAETVLFNTESDADAQTRQLELIHDYISLILRGMRSEEAIVTGLSATYAEAIVKASLEDNPEARKNLLYGYREHIGLLIDSARKLRGADDEQTQDNETEVEE